MRRFLVRKHATGWYVYDRNTGYGYGPATTLDAALQWPSIVLSAEKSRGHSNWDEPEEFHYDEGDGGYSS